MKARRASPGANVSGRDPALDFGERSVGALQLDLQLRELPVAWLVGVFVAWLAL